MMDKTQHGARLLEELDLLQKTKNSSEPTNRSHVLCFWKWKGLGFLDEIRKRRSKCVVCLQVHQISGLPPSMDGRVLAVEWKTKGWKGEQTLPVHVCEGIARFDEIFLHYCNSNIQSTMKSFSIWVSLVDAAECNLGTFYVDLSELLSDDNSNLKFGGKTMSFDLGGTADEGDLSVSVYCRMLEEEPHDSHQRSHFIDAEQSRTKCFSCLPDLNCFRGRPLTVSTRRVPSLRSDPGFITIENSIDNNYPMDDEEGGFITIEKGIVRTRSFRPPSYDYSVNTDEESGESESDKPCLFMDLNQQFDVERVEDEFLRMLEEKQWKARDSEFSDVDAPWKKGLEESLNLNLDLDLGQDLDLDSLIRVAELELTKVAQIWKSRVGAALLEKEEYEELVKGLGSNEDSSSGCSGGFGFGSPI